MANDNWNKPGPRSGSIFSQYLPKFRNEEDNLEPSEDAKKIAEKYRRIKEKVDESKLLHSQITNRLYGDIKPDNSLDISFKMVVDKIIDTAKKYESAASVKKVIKKLPSIAAGKKEFVSFNNLNSNDSCNTDETNVGLECDNRNNVKFESQWGCDTQFAILADNADDILNLLDSNEMSQDYVVTQKYCDTSHRQTNFSQAASSKSNDLPIERKIATNSIVKNINLISNNKNYIKHSILPDKIIDKDQKYGEIKDKLIETHNFNSEISRNTKINCSTLRKKNDASQFDDGVFKIPKPISKSSQMKNVSNAFENLNRKTDIELQTVRVNKDIDECKKFAGTLFVGFQTASNKQIKISDEAMAKVKSMFEDLDEMSFEDEFCNSDFESVNIIKEMKPEINTACNKKITVSGSDLLKAKSAFQDVEQDAIKLVEEVISKDNIDATRSSKNIGQFSGFSTASNKKIAVSESALSKAKILFQDVEKDAAKLVEQVQTIDNINATRSTKDIAQFSGFSTASNKKIAVSESALSKAKTLFQDVEKDAAKLVEQVQFIDNVDATRSAKDIAQFSGFSTASNKKIAVSESALLKAKNLFQDVEQDAAKLIEQVQFKDNINATRSAKDIAQFSGFSTASNKQISVSKSALLKAKALFQDVEKDAAKLVEQVQFIDNVDATRSAKDIAQFSGFSTASNKKIAVSESALLKAKNLFQDVEQDAAKLIEQVQFMDNVDETRSAKDIAQFSGFSTASNKQISVSKSALLKAKDLFQNVEKDAAKLVEQVQFIDNVDATRSAKDIAQFSGFSTASNKKIAVSESALLKAKNLFQDVEQDAAKLIEQVQFMDNVDETRSAKDIAQFSGFSTASKKTYDNNTKEGLTTDVKLKGSYNVHDEFLACADSQVMDSEDLDFIFNEEMRVIEEDEIKASEKLIEDLSAFKTANNNIIKISERALSTANNLICDSIIKDCESLNKITEEKRFKPYRKNEAKTVESIDEHTSTSKSIIRNVTKEVYKDELKTGDKIRALGKSKINVKSNAMNETYVIKEDTMETADKMDTKVVELNDWETFFNNTFGSSDRASVSATKTNLIKRTSEDSDDDFPNSPILTSQRPKINSVKDYKSIEVINVDVRESDTILFEEDTKANDDKKFQRIVTANNGDVNVSNRAFKSSKKLFENVDMEDINRYMDETDVLNKSRVKNVDPRESINCLNSKRDDSSKIEDKRLIISEKSSKIDGVVVKDKVLEENTVDSFEDTTKLKRNEKVRAVNYKTLPIEEVLGSFETNTVESNAADQEFKTTYGKSTVVSEVSLLKVQDLFTDALTICGVESTETGDQKSSRTAGFKNASNKGVLMSDGDLLKGKIVLRNMEHVGGEIIFDQHQSKEETDVASCTKNSRQFSGFSTASNKKICVSESALSKVKTLFHDVEKDAAKLVEQVQFIHNIDATRSAKDIGQFSGFSTASNKQISVSESALTKAKTLFQDVEKDAAKLVKQVRSIDNIYAIRSAKDIGQFSGFSTASNKKISVSESALLKAKTLFQDVEKDAAKLVEQVQFIDNVDATRSAKDIAQFSGFSTASNKKIAVSESALLKAKNLFQDVEQDAAKLIEQVQFMDNVDETRSAKDIAQFSGFSTASNKQISVSKSALLKAKDLFQNVEKDAAKLVEQVQFIDNVDATRSAKDIAQFSGFSTASNKKIAVSESALLKAKNLFQDVEQDAAKLIEQVQFMDNVDETRSAKDIAQFSGFSTASKKTYDNNTKEGLTTDVKLKGSYNVHDEFLACADSQVMDSEDLDFIFNEEMRVIEEDEIKASEKLIEDLSAFKTANNNIIKISERALSTANNLICDSIIKDCESLNKITEEKRFKPYRKNEAKTVESIDEHTSTSKSIIRNVTKEVYKDELKTGDKIRALGKSKINVKSNAMNETYVIKEDTMETADKMDTKVVELNDWETFFNNTFGSSDRASVSATKTNLIKRTSEDSDDDFPNSPILTSQRPKINSVKDYKSIEVINVDVRESDTILFEEDTKANDDKKFQRIVTANNGDVNVSNRAFKSSKKLFENVDMEDINRYMDETDVLNKSRVKNVDPRESINCLNSKRDDSSKIEDKRLIISEKSSKIDGVVVKDKVLEENTVDSFEDTTKLKRNEKVRAVNYKTLPIEEVLGSFETNTVESNAADQEFKTTYGKSTVVSEVSLLKVQDLFTDALTICGVESTETGDQKSSRTAGFKNASNKGVLMSDGDLLKGKIVLRNMEHVGGEIIFDQHQSKEETDVASCTKNSRQFSGFSTASNKKICVSESALSKVKTLFHDVEKDAAKLVEQVQFIHNIDATRSAKDIGQFSGFSTASNKQISVSESALTKAKTLFQDVEKDAAKLVKQVRSIDNIYAIRSAKDIGQFSGFSTASNKKISVSESALLKAKTLFQDVEKDAAKLVEQVRSIDNIDATRSAKDIGKFSGFSTASNKQISVSKSALLIAKTLFQDVEKDAAKLVEQVQIIDNMDTKRSAKDIGQFSGLSTASNKKISVSESALSKAKTLFQDVEKDAAKLVEQVQTIDNINETRSAKDIGKFSGFSTASNKQISVSKSALLKAKTLFQDVEKDAKNLVDQIGFDDEIAGVDLNNFNSPFTEEHASDTNVNNNNFVGFSTASNKCIAVSKAALKKVDNIFKGVETEANDLLNTIKRVENDDGFMNNMQRSETAQNRSKNLFEGAGTDEKEFVKDTKCHKTFGNSSDLQTAYTRLSNSRLGFSRFTTTSDVVIPVSLTSLAMEKKMFEDLDADCENSSLKVTSDERRGTEQFVHESMSKEFDCLNTPSNEKILASEKALTKAKSVFKDITNEEFESSTGNKSVTMNPFGAKDLLKIKLSFPRFTTANNKEITVSNDALTKARSLFQDVERMFEERDDANEQFDSLVSKNTSIRDGNLSDRDKSNFVFNNTSNKAILESEKAINKARDVFKNKEDFRIEEESVNFKGFVTENRNTMNVSEQAMKCTKELYENLDEDFSNDTLIDIDVNYNTTDNVPNSSSFRGFSTANNKKIDISKEALLKAKNIFKEFERNDLIIESENTVNGAVIPNLKYLAEEKLVSLNNFDSVSRNAEPSCSKIQDSHVDIKIGKRKRISEDEGVSKKFAKESVTCVRDSLSQEISDCTIALMADENLRNDTVSLTQDDIEAPSSPILPCRPKNKKKSFKVPYKDVNVTSRNCNEEEPILKKPKLVDYNDGRLEYASKNVDAVDNVASSCIDICDLLNAKSKRGNKKITLKDVKDLNNDNRKTVADEILKLTPENFEGFLFTKERIDIAAVKGERNEIKVEQLSEIFLNHDNIDRKLIPRGWIVNHLKWIIWKLASYERFFNNSCRDVLTVGNVLKQLMYRYDRELHRAQRPVLRKIMECDDTPGKRMVLCVSRIVKINEEKQEGETSKSIWQGWKYEMEVTDGWYGVLTTIDTVLTSFVISGKIRVGTKLVTCGAELFNCGQGKSPLEDISMVRLRLHGNSTRLAPWSSRLGLCPDAGPLRMAALGLKARAGPAPLLSLVPLIVYPQLYVERLPTGDTVTRSERLETLYLSSMESDMQARVEQLYIQAEQEVCQSSSATSQQFSDGDGLLRDMDRANDPMEFLASLSNSQRMELERALTERQSHTRNLVDQRVKDLMNEQGLGANRRKVVSILKVRGVVLEKSGDGTRRVVPALLTVWKAEENTLALLQGKPRMLHVYKAVPTGIRNGELHLSTSKQTVFSEVTNRKSLDRYRELEKFKRNCTPIREMNHQGFAPIFNEVDTVGIVFHVEPPVMERNNTKSNLHNLPNMQTVYLTDEGMNFVAIHFWGGIVKFGYEKLIEIGKIISCSNLQHRPKTSRKRFRNLYASEYSTFTQCPRKKESEEFMKDLEKKSKLLNIKEYLIKCKITLDELSTLSWSNRSAKNTSYQNQSIGNDNSLTNSFSKTNSSRGFDGGFQNSKRLSDSDCERSRNVQWASEIDENSLSGLDFESTFNEPISNRNFNNETPKSSRSVCNNTSNQMPSTSTPSDAERRIKRLKMYGEPPPMSPLVLNVSNSLKKDFIVPEIDTSIVEAANRSVDLEKMAEDEKKSKRNRYDESDVNIEDDEDGNKDPFNEELIYSPPDLF